MSPGFLLDVGLRVVTAFCQIEKLWESASSSFVCFAFERVDGKKPSFMLETVKEGASVTAAWGNTQKHLSPWELHSLPPVDNRETIPAQLRTMRNLSL